MNGIRNTTGPTPNTREPWGSIGGFTNTAPANATAYKPEGGDYRAPKQSTEPKPVPKADSYKESGARAGYMELVGAVKDADCSKVEVPGGVASNRGCCNLFEPESKDTMIFSCGTCHHLRHHPATLIHIRKAVA